MVDAEGSGTVLLVLVAREEQCPTAFMEDA